MSASPPSVANDAGAPESKRSARSLPAWAKWTFWGLALAIGVGAGAGIAVVSRTAQRPVAQAPPNAAARPAVTWARGARPAPDFRLTDQNGRTFSLRSLRGRSVLVTFIDPLCRNLCPLEAKVLNDVVLRATPATRPVIAAVSVNPWGDAPANFRQDAVRWQLVPQWRWGIGSHAELARVWRDYEIGVQVSNRTVAGVTVREIAHTEATYLVDASGHERAVFVYPFRAADVLRAVRRLGRSA
jgi:cytochrome oxidase Cu insertion factor (SCO1/SenC/PrrC family)